MSDSRKIHNVSENTVKQTSQSVPAAIPGPTGNEACVEFQKGLAELLDSDHPDLETQPHLQTCEKCAALMRDLEAIAQAARELLPTYDPNPDLWTKIQSGMAAGGGEEDSDDHLGAVAKDGPKDTTGPTPGPNAKPVAKPN